MIRAARGSSHEAAPQPVILARPADDALRRVISTYLQRHAKPGVTWSDLGRRSLRLVDHGRVYLLDLRAATGAALPADDGSARGSSAVAHGLDAALHRLELWELLAP